jgi:hypothetical protein
MMAWIVEKFIKNSNSSGGWGIEDDKILTWTTAKILIGIKYFVNTLTQDGLSAIDAHDITMKNANDFINEQKRKISISQNIFIALIISIIANMAFIGFFMPPLFAILYEFAGSTTIGVILLIYNFASKEKFFKKWKDDLDKQVIDSIK